MLLLHAAPPPRTLSIKALIPCLWGAEGERGVGLWTDVCHPYAQLPATEIKQTFLSTNLACLLAFEQRAVRPPPSPPPSLWGNTHTKSVQMKQESVPTGFLPCLLLFILWLICLIFTRKIFMTRFHSQIYWFPDQPLTCFSTTATVISKFSRYSSALSTPFPQSGTPSFFLTSRKFAQGSASVLPSFLRHLWFIIIRVSLYSCSFMCMLFIPWNNQTNQSSQKTAKIGFFTLSQKHFFNSF